MVHGARVWARIGVAGRCVTSAGAEISDQGYNPVFCPGRWRLRVGREGMGGGLRREEGLRDTGAARRGIHELSGEAMVKRSFFRAVLKVR